MVDESIVRKLEHFCERLGGTVVTRKKRNKEIMHCIFPKPVSLERVDYARSCFDDNCYLELSVGLEGKAGIACELPDIPIELEIDRIKAKVDIGHDHSLTVYSSENTMEGKMDFVFVKPTTMSRNRVIRKDVRQLIYEVYPDFVKIVVD